VNGVYINFMFEPLHVPTAELVPKMRKGIHKFYGRFCTEFIHNGRAKSEYERMPRFWLFPDLPVRKNKGNSLRDVTINGGLHYNEPMLIPPVSRFQECGDIPGLADYAAKTIKNHRADERDILILPRSVTELPDKKKTAFDPKDRLLKDIQSRFNVCDEVAQKMRDDVMKAA